MVKTLLIVSLGRKGYGPVFGYNLSVLLRENYNILLIHSKYSELNEEIRNKDIRNIEVKTFNNLREFAFELLFPIRIIYLLDVILKSKAKIIIWPMEHPWMVLVMLYFRNIKHVIHIHDPIAHSGELKIVKKIHNSIIENMSEITIFLSSNYRKIEKTEKKKKKLRIIPLSVLDFYIKDNHLKKNADQMQILFFGRIRKYKHLSVLLESFNIISNRFSYVNLLIAGEGELKAYSKLINSNRKIKVINRWIKNDEIPGIFSNSYIAVLPYTDATQSGIIPLAYEFGLPVVASDVGSLREQVKDGETGFLIKSNSPEEFAEKIQILIENQDLYIQMKNNIRKMVEKELSNEMILNRYKEIIDEIL